MAPNTSTAFTYANLSGRSYLQPLAANSSDTVKGLSENTEAAQIHSVSATVDNESVSRNTFTGLIVDCRGLGLNAAMSPVIKNEKGVPVYGHKNLDYDLIISKGMVAYTTDIENHERAGCDVDMGGIFDYFGYCSHPDYPDLTERKRKNRNLLRK